MTAQESGQDHLDEVGHAGDYTGNLHVIDRDALDQHAHENSGAHQGGAHHQSGSGMAVDDLFVGLGGKPIVDQQ